MSVGKFGHHEPVDRAQPSLGVAVPGLECRRRRRDIEPGEGRCGAQDLWIAMPSLARRRQQFVGERRCEDGPAIGHCKGLEGGRGNLEPSDAAQHAEHQERQHGTERDILAQRRRDRPRLCRRRCPTDGLVRP